MSLACSGGTGGDGKPETYALMLAGLAAVGFMACRRDNRSKKA